MKQTYKKFLRKKVVGIQVKNIAIMINQRIYLEEKRENRNKATFTPRSYRRFASFGSVCRPSVVLSAIIIGVQRGKDGPSPTPFK